MTQEGEACTMGCAWQGELSCGLTILKRNTAATKRLFSGQLRHAPSRSGWDEDQGMVTARSNLNV